MAKSLRSKWRRKMKAEKRVRYGEKELQRLKDMLTKAGDYQMLPEEEEADKMQHPEEEKIPINAIRHQRNKKPRPEPNNSRKSRLEQFEDEEMEDATAEDKMSVDKAERVFSKRTMKDQFGNYPVWMNKRKMMTQKKKNKRIAKNRALSVSGTKRKRR